MKGVPSNAQLRTEIRNVQAQLKTAIHNHQMIVFKLKDHPVSIKLRVQMCNIQRHIVSLGERQKKLLTQLRQEVDVNGVIIKPDQKPSLKALQNLMPNPLNQFVTSKPINIKKEPETIPEFTDSECAAPIVKPETSQHSSRRKSKLVATTDVPLKNGLNISSPSPSYKENTLSTTPSSSPTHIPNIVKTPNPSENKIPKLDNVPVSSMSDESQDASIHLPADPELRKKLQFMTALSLVTREVLAELKNRRSERKRRSTVNSQFLYGNGADPKRKKTLYLSNSAAGVVPLVNTSNIPVESIKPPVTSVCLSCSSSDGSLSRCSLCHKDFHWNCLFDAAENVPSGEALKCKTCLLEDTSSMKGNLMD